MNLRNTRLSEKSTSQITHMYVNSKDTLFVKQTEMITCKGNQGPIK